MNISAIVVGLCLITSFARAESALQRLTTMTGQMNVSVAVPTPRLVDAAFQVALANAIEWRERHRGGISGVCTLEGFETLASASFGYGYDDDDD